jgi:hypothetical protein
LEQPERAPAGDRNHETGDNPSSRGEKKKVSSTDETKDEEPEKKRKVFPWFGGTADKDKKQEAEQPEAGN